MNAGDRVRFLIGPLGTIDPESGNGFKFAEATVAKGDTGMIAVPPGAMPDGWIAVTPDDHPSLYVPVDPEMVEVIS